MKWFFKFKLGFIITGLFLALVGFFFINFPYIEMIVEMISTINDFSDFKWKYFLQKEFIFFVIVDLGIIGVFVKRRIGWIMAAFTFYFFIVAYIISIFVNPNDDQFSWPSIIFLVFVGIPIWFLNTKDILQRFKSSSVFVNNILVLAIVGLFIGFMYLTRDIRI